MLPVVKFFWFSCLLLVTIVTTSYANASNGLLLRAEAPIELTQCPVYDDPNHIVMLPYPNDCRKYYTCLNGLGYAHQCPDNFYWSQLTYRCDFKQYSNCDKSIDPSEPIKQHEHYSPYPGDCSRYYKTQTLSCPDNYHWNALSQRCDLPQFAGCLSPTSSSIIPSWNNNFTPIVPTAATPPTLIQTTVRPGHRLPINPEYLCINAVGMKYLPYPGDCQKFIYCGPTTNVLYCPDGLYWNRYSQSCDISNSGCQKG
ncbi:probable chitinase 10 [Drosophila innubila]|uniref:probable chitinase 10 n=1 Tax=Drosophila innubila TaxID=198719 RepID=UPI00148CF357|nr:probable chitinase 10 [Drosophila innubila]